MLGTPGGEGLLEYEKDRVVVLDTNQGSHLGCWWRNVTIRSCQSVFKVHS